MFVEVSGGGGEGVLMERLIIGIEYVVMAMLKE